MILYLLVTTTPTGSVGQFRSCAPAVGDAPKPLGLCLRRHIALRFLLRLEDSDVQIAPR